MSDELVTLEETDGDGWDYVNDADGRVTPIPPVGELCLCYVDDGSGRWITVPDCSFHGRQPSAAKP